VAAIACCVVLLVAWLAFLLTTFSAIPKMLIWGRQTFHVCARVWKKAFKQEISHTNR
jgi:hypothetical protein